MKFIKGKDQFGPTYIIKNDNNELDIVFGGNLDLYWIIRSDEEVCQNNTMIITKENTNLYETFYRLYLDIKDINLFNDTDYEDLLYFEDEEEKMKYIKRRAIDNELRKERYKIYNQSNYNELFDEDNDIITWYSDETNHEVANYVTIKKLEDSFKISFNVQPIKDEYDRDFGGKHYIPIRFRNSGSSYDPFNMLFMRMYNNLEKVDDVGDIDHQITIDEYLYNAQKVKKLTK